MRRDVSAVGTARKLRAARIEGIAVTRQWISAETYYKEADFRGLLGMHLQMCKGIGRKWSTLPYLYVDLHAGPGHLEYEGRHFDGSPLIAHDLLTKMGLPYEAMHYEIDKSVAAELAAALWIPVSLVDHLDAERAPIFNEPFEDGFSRWLDQAGRQQNRYGVVYSDPIDDEINYGLLNKTAEFLPHVDLMAYVAATQYKRRRGGDLKKNGFTDKPLIEEHIRAINKRTVLIRTPRGPNQYTFIIWSNWREFPEWECRGFHRIESERGRQILDKINLTINELREKSNTPLWEEGGDEVLPTAAPR